MMSSSKLWDFLLKFKVCYSHKVLYVLLFIYLNRPYPFAMIYYENLDGDEIYNNLIKKTAKNLSTRNVGVSCVSREVVRL